MVGVTGQSAFVLSDRWSGACWKGADALLPHMKADTALAGSERAAWE
jgi:hypothetical protein